jgi:hypothetical protein
MFRKQFISALPEYFSPYSYQAAGWITFDSGQGPEIFHLSSSPDQLWGSKRTGVKTREIELTTSVKYGSEE